MIQNRYFFTVIFRFYFYEFHLKYKILQESFIILVCHTASRMHDKDLRNTHLCYLYKYIGFPPSTSLVLLRDLPMSMN